MALIKISDAFKAGADWLSATVRALHRDQVLTCVDAVQDVRDNDFEQTRFLYVKAKGAFYRLNLSSTASDDGDTVLRDNIGRRYVKVEGTAISAWADAHVADITARGAYDDETEGFVVLVDDTGSGRAAFYTMGDGGSADWQGPAYLTGAEGPQGETGPAGEGFNPAGAWAIGTEYDSGDFVSFGGRTFVSLADENTGHEPPSADEDDSFWMFVPTAVGPQGDPGNDGDGAYVYIAYASADDGSDFTLTFDVGLDYIAILATDTEIETPAVGDFAGLWKNYKGATGSQGIQGEPGNDGSNGTNGADGADGALWYAGATDPDNGNGADGDFYLQTGTGSTGVLGDVWEKQSGTWSKISNIRGASGEGTGDVVGPDGGVTDGHAVLFDTTTGKLIKSAGFAPATAAQGGKADTAVQPDDLSTVATSGAYSDLSGTPDLSGVIEATDTDASGFGFVIDEDDMASDSATKVPTQQSVKAYVDGAEVKEGNIDPTPQGFYTTEGDGVRLWKFADRVLVGDAVTYDGGKNGTEMNSAQSDFAAQTKISFLERDAQLNVVSTEGVTAIVGAVRTGRRSGFFDPDRQRASIGVAGVGVNDSGDADQATWAGYFEAWVKHDGSGDYNRGAYGMEVTVTDSRVGGVADNPYVGIGSRAIGIWLPAAALSATTGDAEGPSSSAIKIGAGRVKWHKGIVFNSDGIEGSDGTTTTQRGRAIEMALGHEIGWRNYNAASDTPSAGAHIRYFGTGTDGFTGLLFGNRTIKLIGAGSFSDEKSLLEINTPASADAANYFKMDLPTAGPPVLTVAGDDTNIDIWVRGKGTGKLVAQKPDTAITSVSDVFQLRHTITSGTPAVGIGTGMDFVAPNAIAANKTGMAIYMLSTDVTNGSEDFDFVLRLMAAGAAHAEKFRVRSTGEPVFRPPSSASALATNGEVTFELTANTTLTFKARGSDGTTRSGTITLA